MQIYYYYLAYLAAPPRAGGSVTPTLGASIAAVTQSTPEPARPW